MDIKSFLPRDSGKALNPNYHIPSGSYLGNVHKLVHELKWRSDGQT